MNNLKKPTKLTYVYSILVPVLLVLSLIALPVKFLSTSSVIPFVIFSLYDIANVLLVKNYYPRHCFGPFLTSVLSFYVFYKLVTVASIVNKYNRIGFFTDGDYSNSLVLDFLMVSLVISTYVFCVFLRFLLSKQRLKQVSKESRKRFSYGLICLVLVGALSLLSWNLAVPYKNKYLEHVSTFSVEKWQQFEYSRINMFDDFEKNHQLVGMNAEDVKKLLGQPDAVKKDMLTYNIGDDKNGHNRLEITLNNDTVTSYEVKTDMYMADVVNKYQK